MIAPPAQVGIAGLFNEGAIVPQMVKGCKQEALRVVSACQSEGYVRFGGSVRSNTAALLSPPTAADALETLAKDHGQATQNKDLRSNQRCRTKECSPGADFASGAP